MKRLVLTPLLFLGLFIARAQTNVDRQLLVEQQNYIAWQAKFTEPPFWIRFEDGLYFLPNTATENRAFAEFQTNRTAYKAFTDQTQRHAFVNSVLQTVDGGQALINPSTNLYPVLNGRKYLWLPAFYLLQSFPNGDALVQSLGRGSETNLETYYVRKLGRGIDDKNYTDGCFIYEGLKSYDTAGGVAKNVKSYVSVTPSLTDADKTLLSNVHAAFVAKNRELVARITQLDNLKKILTDINNGKISPKNLLTN